jgi:hypothetical protein
VWILLAITTVPGSSASTSTSATPGAVEAVAATVDVERVLLREDQERHERMAAERNTLSARLAELYTSLDAAIKRDPAPASNVVDDLMNQVQQAERDRTELLSADRSLVERIRDRLRRISLLEERIASLQVRTEEAAGPLTGKWDIVLMPLGQRGTFILSQTGALVSGTYVLDGGWSGSLQGTLVNRKVYLQRVDSKLGRSADYEGYLAAEGDRIRGTWSNYDVSAPGGSSGQWSAVRRPPSP